MNTLARIDNIAWGHAIGNDGYTCEMPCMLVEDIHAAVRQAGLASWENAMLEARNSITVFLSEHHKARYQDWNQHAALIKESLRDGAWKRMRTELQRRGLEALASSVEWNTLHAAMLDFYADLDPPRFFADMLGIYEAGHLPCGWVGEWPEGQLVIY